MEYFNWRAVMARVNEDLNAKEDAVVLVFKDGVKEVCLPMSFSDTRVILGVLIKAWWTRMKLRLFKKA